MAEKNREFKLVGVGSASSQEKIEKPALSFMQDAWRRLKKNKLAVVSMWFLAILIVFSMISVVLVPRDDANAFNTKEVTTYRNLPPKISDNLPFWNGTITYSGSTEATDVYADQGVPLSLIHISEPTRRTPISYAVFCLKKKRPVMG